MGVGVSKNNKKLAQLAVTNEKAVQGQRKKGDYYYYYSYKMKIIKSYVMIRVNVQIIGKSLQLLKSTDLIHKKNQTASLEHLNLSILGCQICALFHNVEKANIYENHTVEYLNVKLTDIKEWKSSNGAKSNALSIMYKSQSDVIDAKAITGIVNLLSSVDAENNNITMPFVVIDTKYIEFKNLRKMKVGKLSTRTVKTVDGKNEMYKIGTCGDIFISCYESLRMTGLMEWIEKATSSNDSECLITGYGMGGAIASMLLAEIATVDYRKQLRANQAITAASNPNPNVSQSQISSRGDDEVSTLSFNYTSIKRRLSMSSADDSLNIGINDLSSNQQWLKYYLLTFGSPRIFSKPTTEKLARLGLNDRVLRYINAGDPLPFFVDPTSPYGHVGTAFLFETTLNKTNKTVQRYMCVKNEPECDGFDQYSKTVYYEDDCDIISLAGSMRDSNTHNDGGDPTQQPAVAASPDDGSAEKFVRIAHDLNTYLIHLKQAIDCFAIANDYDDDLNNEEDDEEDEDDDNASDDVENGDVEAKVRVKPKTPKMTTPLFSQSKFYDFLHQASSRMSRQFSSAQLR